MLVGYVFPGSMWEGKTPLDFRTDKETGLREGLTVKPTGVVRHNLKNGIEGAVLPPLATWRTGKYIEDMKDDGKKLFAEYVSKADLFDAYVVTGEFTPGNYGARIYLLPKSVSNDPEPPHPMAWTEFNKRGNAVTSYGKIEEDSRWGGFGYGYHSPTTTTSPRTVTAPSTPQAPKKPSVPPKVRIRCGGCGHWFKLDELGSHAEYCCPGINGADSDWAFQCECCDTLDEVQTLKPGFPREKKEEVKAEDGTDSKPAKAQSSEKAEPKPAKEAVASAD